MCGWYDIADNGRLQKVASVLLDYGVRVQKSVFEVRLHDQTLRYLKKRLEKILDPEEDGIKFFPLCESCLARKNTLGNVAHLQKSTSWIVI